MTYEPLTSFGTSVQNVSKGCHLNVGREQTSHEESFDSSDSSPSSPLDANSSISFGQLVGEV